MPQRPGNLDIKFRRGARVEDSIGDGSAEGEGCTSPFSVTFIETGYPADERGAGPHDPVDEAEATLEFGCC